MINFCLTLLTIFSVNVFAQTDIYSEISKLNRSANFAHHTQFIYSFVKPATWTQPYVGFILEGDANQYTAPVAGLKFLIADSPFSFFTEYRQVSLTLVDKNISRTDDFRAGVILDKAIKLRNFENSLSLFNEVYSEGIFSSRSESNVFANIADRLGFEKKWDGNGISQVYLEAYGRRDLLGYYYENLQELRLGLRYKILPPPFSFMISAHYAMGSYTDRQYRTANPHGRYYSDNVVLFTFGARL
jgi:hypothetical protein